jgi:hypothetical protein
MPKTTTNHDFRLRERDLPAKCIICLDDDGQPGVDVVMRIAWDDEQALYGFPVCSLTCAHIWAEVLGRCLDGDGLAVRLALAFIKVQGHHD